MASLVREYDHLQEIIENVPWCKKSWRETEKFDLKDWILLDAWYRSRCLEVPNVGEVMIPCVDMVNHCAEANSYYEPTADGIALLLRPGVKLGMGEEITISYGNAKSEAEMLFSYGFIDKESTAKALTLNLAPTPEDPLGKAKVVAFAKPPVVQVVEDESGLHWDSPFVHFMCLNEEDGLEFRVLQETDGSQSQLKVFWQGLDVTDSTDNFESHIADHELKEIFELRGVSLIEGLVHQQLERLFESEDMIESLTSTTLAAQCQANALQLRRSETDLLQRLYAALDMQVCTFKEVFPCTCS